MDVENAAPLLRLIANKGLLDPVVADRIVALLSANPSLCLDNDFAQLVLDAMQDGAQVVEALQSRHVQDHPSWSESAFRTCDVSGEMPVPDFSVTNDETGVLSADSVAPVRDLLLPRAMVCPVCGAMVEAACVDPEMFQISHHAHDRCPRRYAWKDGRKHTLKPHYHFIWVCASSCFHADVCTDFALRERVTPEYQQWMYNESFRSRQSIPIFLASGLSHNTKGASHQDACRMHLLAMFEYFESGRQASHVKRGQIVLRLAWLLREAVFDTPEKLLSETSALLKSLSEHWRLCPQDEGAALWIAAGEYGKALQEESSLSLQTRLQCGFLQTQIYRMLGQHDLALDALRLLRDRVQVSSMDLQRIATEKSEDVAVRARSVLTGVQHLAEELSSLQDALAAEERLFAMLRDDAVAASHLLGECSRMERCRMLVKAHGYPAAVARRAVYSS